MTAPASVTDTPGSTVERRSAVVALMAEALLRLCSDEPEHTAFDDEPREALSRGRALESHIAVP